MGITHIEDLHIDDFLKTLNHINTLEASEKIDGSANAAVGWDDNGLFFSRPSKGQADKIYSDKWANKPMYNAFRFAFACFRAAEKHVRKALKKDEVVEVEVLYGYTPNSITYNNESIVLLRTIAGKPDAVERLAAELRGKKFSTTSLAYHYGVNGRLYARKEKHDFTFYYKQILHPPSYDASIDISRVESYLSQTSHLGLTNYQVLKTPLNKITVDKRASFKAEREKIEAKLQDMKIDIKSSLADIFLYSVQSAVGGKDTDFIEGVVLRDKSTNNLVKIVDKDVFTAVNKWAWNVRELVQSGIMTDEGYKKGVSTNLRERVGDLLNIPILKTLKGRKMAVENPVGFYKELQKTGFDFTNCMSKTEDIKKLVLTAKDELDKIHTKFKQDVAKNALMKTVRLGGTGKTVTLKFNSELIRRTTDTIMDYKNSLNTILDLLKNIKQSISEYEAWIKLCQIVALI